MDRLRRAHQDRADGKSFAQGLEQGERAVGCIQVGQDEKIGLARKPRIGEDALAQGLVHGGVSLHFPVHLQIGRPFGEQAHRLAHFPGGSRVRGSET